MKNVFFAIAGLAALTAVAHAQTPQQMARCAAMTGTLQRLACYDAAARDAGVAAVPAVRPAAPVTASAPAPAYAPQPAYVPPPAGLGSERLPSTVKRQKTQSLQALVSAIQFDGYGRFTVTLENGQVWRQLSGDETILRNPKITQVKITRGALGSYDMAVPGSHASYRVTRLK